MYLSWAAYYEGGTDASYYDVLLPRILDEILMCDGKYMVNVPTAPAVRIGMHGRSIEAVSREICQAIDAFHILFIHADTGGRGLEARIENRREAFAEAAYHLCGWPMERSVFVSPRHETEAWALADPEAVCRAMGYSGKPETLRLPPNGLAAERLRDPKAELDRVVQHVTGRASGSSLLTAIAQEQSIELLRRVPSFHEFESNLRHSLSTLGCL